MTVIFQASYVLPGPDMPLTHARIGHSLNWRAGGTAVASTTAMDYYADAPLNTLTYEKWKPTTTAGSWEYNHGSAVSCDYCCIAAHTLGTSVTSIKVQYHNGSTWVDLCATTAIPDNSPIMAIFAPVTATRWRVNLISGTAAPELGVVKFGLALQMERPLFGGHTPMVLARNTVMKMNESESGEYLGRSKWRTYLETQFEWKNLSDTWIRTNWPNFQRAVETEPFFIAWRPITYSEVAFGRAMGSANPGNSGTRNLMDVTLEMRGLSHD